MKSLLNRIRARIADRLVDERGANAIEYGLIAAVIAVAIVGSAYLFGFNVQSLFVNASEVVQQ